MDSKVVVAIEFGYEEEIINHIVQEKSFKDAGSLVDYLYQLSIEDDFRKVKENISNVKIRKQKAINDKLMKETEKLYLSSKCVHCRQNDRNIVCLPCSHFSLCKVCTSFIRHCPRCKTFISETIMVYCS